MEIEEKSTTKLTDDEKKQHDYVDEMILAADFETKILKSDYPCVLEFYATWCPPC